MPLLAPRPSSSRPQLPEHSLLNVRSTLAELSLHACQVPANSPLSCAADRLLEQGNLPGIVVCDDAQSPGVLSRAQIFEALCQDRRAQTTTSLQTLLRWSPPSLCLGIDTSILTAAKQALRRPTLQQGVPIAVETETGCYLLDSTVLNQAYWHLRGIETQIRYERLQLEQLQNDKMSDLGRLVDGVAHEILDPVSFIWGNLSHISSYSQDLLDLMAAYAAELPQPSAQLQQRCREVELDYLQADLPEAIRSVRSGAHRLRQLAISLQNFCHIDEVYPKPADLHGLLDSLLLLLQSRIKTPLQIERDYGKLPPVTCFAGQLGQVFMSTLVSATDALLASYLDSALDEPPTLTLSTTVCTAPAPINRWVEILICDNGPGLPAAVEQAVTDTCSTQTRLVKEISLAMSYRIVTAKHGGQFQVRSQQFTQPHTRTVRGTEFKILLPLAPPEPRP
ncbi:MAG: HAMP domain-containing sensor histidine kinase [Cyanobacteria bacterium J06628_6]